ncbi:hypothetical protein MRB53_005869 [Persea americana]|uniref:Uncharacterized protein n=1 Tax=Persea americana TaxID=3435 RepID=A0ACC2MFE7_PERAE|nr:hypothetical protein MRB53_005869 [Persea americana]
MKREPSRSFSAIVEERGREEEGEEKLRGRRPRERRGRGGFDSSEFSLLNERYEKSSEGLGETYLSCECKLHTVEEAEWANVSALQVSNSDRL